MSDSGNTAVKMVTRDRDLVAADCRYRISNLLMRQQVGYLIDAAKPVGDGEYRVPGETIESLRALLTNNHTLQG